MLGRQRLAVDLISEQHAALRQSVERHVFLIISSGNSLIASAVEAGGPKKPGFRPDAGHAQQVTQIGAAPNHIGDAARGDIGLVGKAGALVERLNLSLRQPSQFVQIERQRPLDQALDRHAPGCCVDARDAVMGDGEEVALRSDGFRQLVQCHGQVPLEPGRFERGRQSGRGGRFAQWLAFAISKTARLGAT
jgi:hypothetical protein